MTQPIQEPSTDRALQGFAYARDQIFRRPAPSAAAVAEIPWARRAQYDTTDQSITDGSEINVQLNTFFTDFPDYFEAHDSGTEDGIEVQVDGLYMITYRLFWDDWPNAHQITFNGIDPDAWAGYSFNHSDGGFNNTFSSAGGFSARLAFGQDIYMSVSHAFGSARSLEGYCGCFFEMQFLGPTTTIYTGCDLPPAS